MSKNRRGPMQTVMMNDLMKEHLKKELDDEYWKYDDDWDDKRVASVVNGSLRGSNISPGQVGSLRLQLFGAIGPKAGMGGSYQEMQTIKDTLTKLAGKIDAVMAAHNRLCDTLSLNKHAHVQHLKVLDK